MQRYTKVSRAAKRAPGESQDPGVEPLCLANCPNRGGGQPPCGMEHEGLVVVACVLRFEAEDEPLVQNVFGDQASPRADDDREPEGGRPQPTRVDSPVDGCRAIPISFPRSNARLS